jgi:hypothetical protein
MTALATSEDVEAAIGRTLTADEITRADENLIPLASAYVQDWTGFRFAPGEYTVGRLARHGRVVLPASVATVDEVREIDQCDGSVTTLTLTTDYTVRGRTVYGLGSAFVEVDFTVTDAVPVEIVALVAGIAAGSLAGPPVGASQESAGPFSISYVNSSGRVFLSVSDKAILRRYKQPKPALSILR